MHLLAHFCLPGPEACYDSQALSRAQTHAHILHTQTCRAARAALHAETADQKVVRAFGRGSVPNPLDLIARRSPAHVAALEAACLRALCEVVSLAARNKVGAGV